MSETARTVPYWVRLRMALAAAALGLMLLYGVGFAEGDMVSAISGVARHAFGFPGL